MGQRVGGWGRGLIAALPPPPHYKVVLVCCVVLCCVCVVCLCVLCGDWASHRWLFLVDVGLPVSVFVRRRYLSACLPSFCVMA